MSGACVECIADADCPSERSCVSGACVECIADADCPGDLLCSKHGFCSDGAGFCTTDADCPLRGQICGDGVTCEGPGVSVCGPEYPESVCGENYVGIGETCKATQPPKYSECFTRSDCPSPYYCGENGACISSGCIYDTDCPSDGETCYENACWKSCTSDVECPENRVCIEELCLPAR